MIQLVRPLLKVRDWSPSSLSSLCTPPCNASAGVLCSSADKKRHKASRLTRRRRSWVLSREQVCLWDGGDVSKADGLRGNCSKKLNKTGVTTRQVCIFWFCVGAAQFLDVTSHSHTKRRWCKHCSTVHFCRQNPFQGWISNNGLWCKCAVSLPALQTRPLFLPSSPTAAHAWPPVCLPADETITQRDKALGSWEALQRSASTDSNLLLLPPLVFQSLESKAHYSAHHRRWQCFYLSHHHHSFFLTLVFWYCGFYRSIDLSILTPAWEGETEIKTSNFTWSQPNADSSNHIFLTEKFVIIHIKHNEEDVKPGALCLCTAATGTPGVWSVRREKLVWKFRICQKGKKK